MPAADVQIKFRADSRRRATPNATTPARGERTCSRGLGQADQSANRAARSVDNLGDEAKQASIGVTSLGRAIFKTSAEAKQFGGVFQDSRGRIREATGEYAKASETVDKLGDSFKGTARDGEGLGRSFGGASGGSQILTRSISTLSGVLGALGIAAVTAQLTDFTRASARAAIQIDANTRALTALEGSAFVARQELRAIQNLSDEPGLRFSQAIDGQLR